MRKSTAGIVILIILLIPLSTWVTEAIHKRQHEKLLQRDAALFAAIGSGDAASVRSLLDQGADPNARADPNEDLAFHQPHHTAFYTSQTPLIAGVFANPKFPPSPNALKSGGSEIIDLLLKRGADIESLAFCGTPLMSAITCGDTNTAEILLAHGARTGTLNTLNQPHFTAWFLAANQHSVAMLDLLLKYHENVNVRNEEQRTALSLAAEHGDLPIVGHLLKMGADANIPDETESIESGGKHVILNMTSLRWAADRGHAQVVKVLLAYHANPNLPNYAGVSILHEVGGNDRNAVKAIRKMLKDAGAVSF